MIADVTWRPVMCWPEEENHFIWVQIRNHGQDFLTAAVIQVVESHPGKSTLSVVVRGTTVYFPRSSMVVELLPVLCMHWIRACLFQQVGTLA